MKGSGTCHTRQSLSYSSQSSLKLKRYKHISISSDDRIQYSKIFVKIKGVKQKTWSFAFNYEKDWEALEEYEKATNKDLFQITYTSRKALYEDICKVFNYFKKSPPDEKVVSKIIYTVDGIEGLQIKQDPTEKEYPLTIFFNKPPSSEISPQDAYLSQMLNNQHFKTLKEVKQAVITVNNTFNHLQN